MESITSTFKEILGMKSRKLLLQAISFGMIVVSAVMIWKSAMVLSFCKSPIVVVLSGSMEPSFYRGDILIVTNLNEPYVTGDIVVYQMSHDIPIVHRLITVQEIEKDGEAYLLTKGDNNHIDDRGLYDDDYLYLNKKHILGKIRAQIPYIGIFTIIMNDYPYVKYVVIGGMLIMVLVSKEPQS